MRLIKIHIKNYRTIDELKVSFGDARTLISGPNEAGKSTLVDAIRDALFTEPRTTSKAVDLRTRQAHSPGEVPTIELEFEAGIGADAGVWTVYKRFNRLKAKTELRRAGHGVLADKEAAGKLQALVGGDSPGWAHLWALQGGSLQNPGEALGTNSNDLIATVSSQGVAAAVQSPTDSRVLKQVRDECDRLLTDRGDAKTGTPWHAARGRAAGLRQELQEATDAVTKLQEASDSLREAGVQEREAIDRKSNAEAERNQAIQRKQVLDLAKSAADANQGNLESARAELQALDTREQTLAEGAAKLKQLEAMAMNQRAKHDSASAKHEAASKEASTASAKLADAKRAKLDAQDRVRALEHRLVELTEIKRIQRLDAELAAIQELESEVEDLHRALGALAAPESTQLASLRGCEQAVSLADASLRSLTTSIELIGSGRAVTVDQSALQLGQPRHITQSTTIEIDGAPILRVTPGGVMNLATHEDQWKQSVSSRDRLLAELGVTNLEEAEDRYERSVTLGARLQTARAAIEAKNRSGIAEEKAEASTLLERAKAKAEAAKASLVARGAWADELVHNAEDADALQQQLTAAEILASESESSAKDLEAEESALRTILASTQATRERASQQLSETAAAILSLESELRGQEGAIGDAPARAARRATLGVQISTLERTIAETLTEDMRMELSRLVVKIERMTNVITLAEDARRDSTAKAASARTLLRQSDVDRDPTAFANDLRVRHAAAAAEEAAEARKAKAVDLLLTCLTDAQKEVQEQIAQPLMKRAQRYLDFVNPLNSKARIELDEEGKFHVHASRSDSDTFNFDQLSGGAKEQLAAALRLMTAESIAAQRGETIPIVFDDAFAFTDPVRVQGVLDMLEAASKSRVQVVVLTCTPDDYALLGAKEVRLPQPTSRASAFSGPDGNNHSGDAAAER